MLHGYNLRLFRKDFYWICSSDNVFREPSLSDWKKARFCLAFF